MLAIVDQSQRVIMRVDARIGPSLSRTAIASGDLSRVMAVLRSIPSDILKCQVQYPLINDTFYPFTLPEDYMNIDFFVERDVQREAEKREATVGYKTIYMAPLPDELPNDGIFTYQTIETAGDLLAAPERSVVLLRADQTEYLKLAHDFAGLLKVTVIVLSGLPMVEYSVDFESAAHGFERASYASMISELTQAIDDQKVMEAQSATLYSQERDSYTRANGTVKEHTKFSAPDDPADSGDEIADDLSFTL